MNVRDDTTHVVHLVMQAPVRGARGQQHPIAGMTECVLYFRWWGQSPFYNNELVGFPVEDPPTCLFCLTDV